jgi:hypothetical protein
MAKTCKVCGKRAYSDYCMQHKPRKPIATRTPLPRPTHRIRPEAIKTREKRLQTTADWYAANPPDKDGNWYCYIPKHPLCPWRLTVETIVLEHDLSKARRKDLQFDITNIHPACGYDNKAKGSLSAKEYMAL